MVVNELGGRIETLSGRIESSLSRLANRKRYSVISDGERPVPSPSGAPDPAVQAELDETRADLARAEGNVRLQAQRCAALEDRVAELELLLTRETRARQEAELQGAAADRKVEELRRDLESARKSSGSAKSPASLEISRAFQEKLLEVEQLTRQRDTLRRSTDEWRTRARALQRERDELTEKFERAQVQLVDLRARDDNNKKRLEDLQRLSADQARELEVAERRTQHLRQRLGASMSR